MIRVLHSVSNMDRAGIETMVMNFYRHIDREQIQFDFLSNKQKPGAYEPEIAEMGGRVFRSPGLNPLKFPRYVSYLKKTLRENPEIKILHVHNGALGLYALAAGKLCGLNARVYHAHGAMLPAGRGRSLKRLCRPLIDPFAPYKLACGEKAAAFYYHHKTIREGNYTLIHNAIELERFAFQPAVRDQMRAEHGLNGHTVFGHIGRYSAQKNPLRLLDIFRALHARVPDALLVMIGEGDLREAIEQKAAALGLQDAVRLIPPVSDPERWYQAMDAFVLPSVWEGLPVVSIEAQAAGLPCALSASVSAEAGVTSLVRFIDLAESDEAWADKILAQLAVQQNRPDTREALRAAGYDIRLEAKKLQDYYLKITGA